MLSFNSIISLNVASTDLDHSTSFDEIIFAHQRTEFNFAMVIEV